LSASHALAALITTPNNVTAEEFADLLISGRGFTTPHIDFRQYQCTSNAPQALSLRTKSGNHPLKTGKLHKFSG
jgi:hypothetical protein